MNEETMTNVEETKIPETTETYEDYESPESSDNGLAVKAILGVGAVLAAGAVVWRKTKNKREAWQVKRLEKKGYAVSKIEDEKEVETARVRRVEDTSNDEETEE